MTQKVNIIISGDNSQFKKSVSEVSSTLSSLSSASEKSLSKIAKSSAILGSVIGNVITKAFSSLNSTMDSAIARLDTLNNFPRVMTNLGISADVAQQSIDYLSEKLVGLPTKLDDAASAVQRLTAMNGDIKASTEAYLALNNALLAGGAEASRQAEAMKQLSEAYAKGKPDAREYRILMETMPAQMNQLAQSMGYASGAIEGDFYEAIQSGKVSMNDFLAQAVKLNKEGTGEFLSFEEQARNATGGVATSITNLKTAISRGMANIMNTIGQSNIAGFFQKVISVVNTATKYVQAFVQVMINAWNVVAKLFGGGTIKASSMGSAISSAGASTGGLADSAEDASNGLASASKNAKKLKQQLAGFDEMNVLKEPDSGSDSGGSVGGGGVDTSGIDISGFGDIGGQVSSIVDEIAAKLEWLQPIFEKVFTALRKAIEDIKLALAEVDWQTFAEIAGNVITFIIEMVSGMITTYTKFYNKVAPYLKKISKWLADHGELIGKIIAVLTLIKTPLSTVLTLVTKVVTAWANWNKVKTLMTELAPVVTKVKDVYNVLNEKLINVGATIGTALAHPIESAQGLFARLGDSGAILGTKLKDIGATILNVVMHPFESLHGVGLRLGEMFKSLWSTIASHPLVAIIALVATAILTNEELRDCLMELLQKCLEPLKSIWDALKVVMEPISGILQIIGEIVGDILIPPLELLGVVLDIVGAAIKIVGDFLVWLATPINDAIGWFTDLLGITNENEEANNAYKTSLSEVEQEFDSNGDGALDLAENLVYLKKVMNDEITAEETMLQSQKNLEEKTAKLKEAGDKYGKTVEELIELHKQGQLETIASGDELYDLKLMTIDVEKATYSLESATSDYNKKQGESQSEANKLKEKYDEVGQKMVDLAEKTGFNTEEYYNLEQEYVELQREIKETGKNVGEMVNWEEKARDAGVKLGEGLENGAVCMVPKIEQTGRNMGQGLANGSLGMSSTLYNAGWRNADSYLNGVKQRADIHSPSKEASKLGAFLGKGMVQGIEKLNSDIESAGYESASYALEGIENSIKDLSLDELELNVVAKVDDNEVFKLSDTLDRISESNVAINEDDKVSGDKLTQVVVKIGEDTLLDKIIDGINEKSQLFNGNVINV